MSDFLIQLNAFVEENSALLANIIDSLNRSLGQIAGNIAWVNENAPVYSNWFAANK